MIYECDSQSPSLLPTIEAPASQWRELQEGAALIKQCINPLPGQQLATRRVPLHSSGTPCSADL